MEIVKLEIFEIGIGPKCSFSLGRELMRLYAPRWSFGADTTSAGGDAHVSYGLTFQLVFYSREGVATLTDIIDANPTFGDCSTPADAIQEAIREVRERWFGNMKDVCTTIKVFTAMSPPQPLEVRSPQKGDVEVLL